jgi:hypothetical protein
MDILLPASVPQKGENDDDRYRHAQQPQQNTATHDFLLNAPVALAGV